MWSPTYKYDYLCHHGILGMHWGKKNGPPYPLDAEDHSQSEKKAGWRKSLSDEQKTKIKTAAKITTGVLLGAAVVGGTIYLAKTGKLDNVIKSGKDIVNNFKDTPVGELKGKPNITEQAKQISKELGLNFKKVESVVSQDAIMGNPGWKENKNSPDFDEKWANNCGHSVMNFVLRRKGLDTKATEMAFDESGGLSIGELCSYFKDAHPSKEIQLRANDNNPKTLEKIAKKYIKEKLNGLDEGACGAIEVRSSQGGHFIAWANDSGEIKILNTQIGSDNADDIFSSMSNPNGGWYNKVRFVRLDNLELNYKKCKQRPFSENM